MFTGIIEFLGSVASIQTSPDGAKLAVTEVAFLLGFSDASAFHKAFRRWTARAPGERRRS